jgi:hypothetical protein
MSEGNLKFQIDSKSPVIEILSGFDNVLNTEELNYIQMYADNEKVYFDSIPSKSRQILIALNLKLHKEAALESTKTYITDSLNKLLPFEQKEWRGSLEVTVFISTDPEDPTIGLDSFYLVPYEDQIKDSSHYLGLSYVFMSTTMNYTLVALSSTFEIIDYSNTYNLLSYGYVNINDIHALSIQEMQMINYCIWFSMNGKLKYNDRILNAYLKEFNIHPLVYNRRNFEGLIIQDGVISNYGSPKK